MKPPQVVNCGAGVGEEIRAGVMDMRGAIPDLQPYRDVRLYAPSGQHLGVRQQAFGGADLDEDRW